MKWITHQAGAGLGAMALGLSAPAVGMAVFGAIIPDMIDQKLSGICGKDNRQKIFNRIHRGSSHWFGWWLALFMLVSYTGMPLSLREIFIGVAFGALSHVGLDFLTPRGVPLLPFTRKVQLALPICSTNTWGEWLFLLVMLACGFLYWRHDMLAVIRQIGAYFN